MAATAGRSGNSSLEGREANADNHATPGEAVCTRRPSITGLQLSQVEQRHGMAKVGGSNPLRSTSWVLRGGAPGFGRSTDPWGSQPPGVPSANAFRDPDVIQPGTSEAEPHRAPSSGRVEQSPWGQDHPRRATRGCREAAIPPALGAGTRRFESCHPHDRGRHGSRVSWPCRQRFPSGHGPLTPALRCTRDA